MAYVFFDSSNPFFTDVARGADDALRDNGLALVMCTSGGDPGREDEYLSLLLEQRVHGVLITSADYDNPMLERLARHNLPVVLVDRSASRRSQTVSMAPGAPWQLQELARSSCSRPTR